MSKLTIEFPNGTTKVLDVVEIGNMLPRLPLERPSRVKIVRSKGLSEVTLNYPCSTEKYVKVVHGREVIEYGRISGRIHKVILLENQMPQQRKVEQIVKKFGIVKSQPSPTKRFEDNILSCLTFVGDIDNPVAMKTMFER